MAKDPNDPFNDLFEPFGLDGGHPEDGTDRQDRETVPVRGGDVDTSQEGTYVFCSSCGNANHASNRHCEMCGARLVRSQTPVAPQPMLRTTAGARALVVLSSIILAVAVLALLMNLFSGGDGEVAASSSSTSTTQVTLPIGQLTPIRVDCTSQLEEQGFGCANLIDDDPDNRWNATPDEGILDAEVTFFFSPPVQITEMFLVNVTEDGAFNRNARIQGLEIVIDDLAQSTIVELDDTNEEPQRVQIRSLSTSSLTMKITSAYPGTSFDGEEPFPELALQEVQFFGRTAPEG